MGKYHTYDEWMKIYDTLMINGEFEMLPPNVYEIYRAIATLSIQISLSIDFIAEYNNLEIDQVESGVKELLQREIIFRTGNDEHAFYMLHKRVLNNYSEISVTETSSSDQTNVTPLCKAV